MARTELFVRNQRGGMFSVENMALSTGSRFIESLIRPSAMTGTNVVYGRHLEYGTKNYVDSATGTASGTSGTLCEFIWEEVAE